MGIHQGGVPHEPEEGDQGIEMYPGRFNGSINDGLNELRSALPDFFMKEDIKYLIDNPPDGFSRWDPKNSELLRNIYNYLASIKDFDFEELKRRLGASEQFLRAEAREKSNNDDSFRSLYATMADYLIKCASVTYARFEMSLIIQFAHDSFCNGVIQPFISSIDSALESLDDLPKYPNPKTTQLPGPILRDVGSIVSQKDEILNKSESWGSVDLLAITMATLPVIEGFERDILQPLEIDLGEGWKAVLGQAVPPAIEEGVNVLVRVYADERKKLVLDAFNRLEAALPPMIRLA